MRHSGDHPKRTKDNFQHQRQQICDLAARIIQEDGVRDYHKAKLRACERLHLSTNTALPSNREIELALKQRLQLFANHQQSQSKHHLAIELLKQFAPFKARLVGSIVNQIELKNAPIEIHLFSDSPEAVLEELNWSGIAYTVSEKRYRYRNNELSFVALVCYQVDQQDIELSVFAEKQLHRSPICPSNNKAFKRLSLTQASDLFMETEGG